MNHVSFDCRTLVQMVTDWLEGEVEEPTLSELELHVATCSGCLAYIDQVRAMMVAMSQLDGLDTNAPTNDDSRARLIEMFRDRERIASDPSVDL